MQFSTVRSLTLALHTDLANLDNYEGNPVLLRALVETAEEKLHVIASHLAQVRRVNGFGGCALVIGGEG